MVVRRRFRVAIALSLLLVVLAVGTAKYHDGRVLWSKRFEYLAPPTMSRFGKVIPRPGTKEFAVDLRPGQTVLDLDDLYRSGHIAGWGWAHDEFLRSRRFRWTSKTDIYHNFGANQAFIEGFWDGYSQARAHLEDGALGG